MANNCREVDRELMMSNVSKSQTIRLQKYISNSGVTSRRKAEVLILEGKVTVNGQIIREMGVKICPKSDVIQVEGNLVDHRSVEKLYLIMNKPRGVMTTLNDPEGRETIIDLIPEISERIYPVGRLDYLSEGLLILTNDGELANIIMHPKFNIIKTYEVKIFGVVNQTILKKLRNGVDSDNQFIKPLSVRVIKQLSNRTWLEIRLGEGKNREIRRLCDSLGLTVDRLKRVAIENLSIDGIPVGKYSLFSKRRLLKELGISDKFEKLTSINYQSCKKSISIRRKSLPTGERADSSIFHKFRKEHYFTTIENIKIANNLTAESESLGK